MRKPYVFEKRKGSGRWMIEWVPLADQRARTGKKRKKVAPAETPAQSRALAELWARQIAADHAAGKEWMPPDERAELDREPTVHDVLRGWLSGWVEADEIARAQGRAPTTLRAYKNHMKLFARFLEESEGRSVSAIPVSRVGTSTLVAFHRWLLTPGTSRTMKGPRQPSTAYKTVSVATQPFNWAAKTDPFRGRVFPLAVPDEIRRQKPARPRFEVPTFEHGAAAIASARGWIRRPMVLMYFTGLRVDSQVMKLEWRHFSLVRDDAHLDLDRRLGKSESERTGRRVPISDHLRDELRRWAEADGVDLRKPPTTGEAKYVVQITAYSKRRPKKVRSLRGRDVKRAWVRAGVWDEAFGQPSHCFRKMLKEGLLYLECDPLAVNRLVGHTVDSSTGLAYARPERWLKDKMRAAVGNIPSLSAAVS